MLLAKLDSYDYTILPGVIRIGMRSSNDPVMVDIMSELDKTNGLIFIEGNYYEYLEEYRFEFNEKSCYLELRVVRIDEGGVIFE